MARLGVIAAVRDAIASRRISAEEVVRHAFELIERLDLAEVWERERPWPLVAPGYDSFEAALGLSAAR